MRVAVAAFALVVLVPAVRDQRYLGEEVLDTAMQPPSADQQTAVIAALLHDIGKFAQRARVPLGEGYRGFDRGVYGDHGAHALHSAQFVEQELGPHLRGCLAPILYHHNPQDGLARIVAAADRLSATERFAESVTDDALYQPLTNVLATVFTASSRPPSPSGFALRRLDPTSAESFFPSPATPDSQAQERDYASLWQDFVVTHRRLDQSDFARYLAGLYLLLQQHTWCVPSAAFRSVPDISLFDHSRTAAAIAAALCAFFGERASHHDSADPLALGGERCFCLVVGDLSGIQSYLYDIADVGVGGVARRLRARSLYLQLIAEVAAHRILAGACLPFLNALMISGGRFHLLLPNTHRAREVVTHVQRDVDCLLVKQFGGELCLNLAAAEFAAVDLDVRGQGLGFGALLERAGGVLAHRKQNRLREALQPEGRWSEGSFLLDGFGGAAACDACGKRPRASGANFCVQCLMDLQVGKILPDTAYLALYDHVRPDAMPVLDHSVALLRPGDRIDGSPYVLWALGECDLALTSQAPVLARPICDYVPTWCDQRLRDQVPISPEETQPGAPVTFEDLAHRASGKPLLGFLQADVDRLGETFVFGLKPGRDTPSRLAQMSRMLDLFFAGWMPHLLRTRFPDCYSVCAGGDDLFVVGPWDQVLELATAVSTDFARLAQNPAFHLSAGILLAKAGYPIARAAEGAGAAMQSAKEAGRDRVSVLGHTLSWQQWQLIRGHWRDLEAETRSVATAFLRHLLIYARMWRRYAEWESCGRDPGHGSVLGLRYQPLMAYELGRNVERRRSPGLHAFATSLLSLRPGDADQRTVLDNLGLLAQLWILGRRSAD